MLTFTTSAKPDEVREPIFTVDDHEYTIAKAVAASAGLEYVRLRCEVNSDSAVMFAMRTALGEDGFNALRGATDVSTEDLKTVMDACTELLLGAVNGPKVEASNA